MGAPLTSIAGLFVTAEGDIEARRGAIDVNIPRANPGSDAARVLKVAALHVTGQAIWRIVSDANRFLFAVVGDHHQHGTKNFLLSDSHVITDLREYGRSHVVAAIKAIGKTGSAADDFGTLSNAGLDQPLNLVPLYFGDHRSHRRGFLFRGPHDHTLCHGRRNGLCLRQQMAGNKHPGRGVTRLSRVVVHVHDAARDRRLQIGILQDDVR